jgi:DNA-binding NtrC family response regulator
MLMDEHSMSIEAPLTIWIVDDEVVILNLYKRMLRHCNKTWNIECFENPIQALKEVHSRVPNIVISDLDMREMGGVEFLDRMRVEAPHAIRFLSSGFRGVIPGCAAHEYLAKPFSMVDLNEKIINAAIAVRQSVKSAT